MNEWKWPIDGPFAGFIQARSLPNIGNFTNSNIKIIKTGIINIYFLSGDFTNYSPTQIQKLSKTEIIKPNPTFSTPSVPKSLWTILMPNSGNNLSSVLCITIILFIK